MPVTLTYPGVYLEEIPSGVRTITGVATSITAFLGRALRGPVNDPIRIQSFADYDRLFGGLWSESTLSYAVQHYFLHGGSDAVIVRVANGATAATLTLPAGAESLTLVAASPGEWGGNLQAIVDHNTKDRDRPAAERDDTLFNLRLEEVDPDGNVVIASEEFLNLSSDPASPRFVSKVLEQASLFMDVQGVAPAARPDATPLNAGNGRPIPVEAIGGGNGNALTDNDIAANALADVRQGLWALDKTDLFNLLCIPPLTRTQDVGDTTLAAAARYCKARRALLIVDPLVGWNTIAQAEAGINALRAALGTDLATNVAAYFPRLQLADPLKENRTDTFVPGGAVAGVFARTDAQRGVWKAPAGIEAALVGVRELAYKMTDGENGRLNPLALNCLRTFPVYGHVLWGARTLAGADRLGSEWKYVSVRRLALFIEESLYRGTQWVVFEPNDEPLWAQIRLNIGTFLQDLFRQGAFQGTSPREAFFVKCDKETTTQSDIDRGIVNIMVGFAPLKPAEFVVLKLQQMTRQDS
ncbi:MAG: phage tail sheath family protein [Caldilineaceae bacterium]|nr:phage tail sheath family protein [Caldilineaceae bacterium]